MKRSISVLAIFAFVLGGALYVQPKMQQEKRLKFEQINTDSMNKYPTLVSAGRTWCVEMVE